VGGGLRKAFVCGIFVLLQAGGIQARLQTGNGRVPAGEIVAPGVEHIEIRRGDFTEKAAADRWTIHALVLDPRRARLRLGRAMDEGVGTETVSSMAARHGALAAVNGGYFRTSGLYRGEPAGLLEVAGRVLSEPSKKRPGLAVADVAGRIRAAVVTVDFMAEVAVETGPGRTVDGVNRPRGDDELILFTPEFHRTTLTGPGGVEAAVVEGLVVAVRDGEGSLTIPANGFVISAAGKSAQWARDEIRAGKRLELKARASMSPELDFVPDFIVGGGPVLVRGGKPASASDPGAYDPGFLEKRHPRTAAGLRADGSVVLVAVDGRHPASSVGMTIREMSDLMIELSCVEAINLDGGGSTTMVVKNKTVNNPSDPTGERPVSDALLVFARSSARQLPLLFAFFPPKKAN
jgi:exopolysaccharide biosynthesis protein